jgi:GT2 family glycosyltransferase
VPSVSVIVPIFNGVAFLPAFFESLNAALPDGSEVVLVDDASTEAVWETVPELSAAASVRRLQNDTNLGYSAAVNRGFRATSSEIVIQLNTDLILEPQCITAMIELIRSEPRVGIVGSKLIFPTTGLVEHVGLCFGNFSKRRVFAQLPATHELCCRTRELQIVSGATVGMTRAVLERVGPLDEEYFNRNEDIEHCLIAHQAGLRNFMCAESVAHHWKSHSGPARFARLSFSDALFWSRWGASREPDLGRFVDEALDHALATAPNLQHTSFGLLDLSRGADQSIVLERVKARWPRLDTARTRFRQMNNPSERLSLGLIVPHWLGAEPTPFIYLVDSYRELEDNVLWFENRRRVVDEELVADLSGVVIPTSELQR